MAQFVEVDEAGEFILDDDGEKNTVDDLNMGGWDHVKGQIPDDLRDEKIWDNVPDTPTLLKNYAHAQKRMGGSLSIPTDESDREVWDDLYGKLGRPESIEGYTDVFGNLPEGFEWQEDIQRGFLDAVHKAGLNNHQTKEIVGWYENWQRDIGMESDRVLGEAETTLRNEWGPNYDGNISLASRAVAKVGGEPLQKLLDETGMGNHPDMIRAFVRVGRNLAEDNIITAEVGGAATSTQAKAKIAEILNDKEHAYHTGKDPSSQEEMRKLHQLAYPAMA